MPRNFIRFDHIQDDTVLVTIYDVFDLDLLKAMTSIL
jgi:hypothetical protein